MIRSARDEEHARTAAQCVVRVHESLAEFVRAGQTLAEIDAEVGRLLKTLNCTSAFLKYRVRRYPPFPSYACLSPNDCIVHGTHLMSEAPMTPGDLLSIDIGVKHKGWIGDAAWTYAIEHASEEAQRLMACGRESLVRGIAAMQAGRPLLDWAKAVEAFVEGECGFHLVEGLGGHGYGKTLHGPPYVSNSTPSYPAEWPDAFKPWTPGMLVAVETMIGVGTGATRGVSRDWPIYTKDGSLSVHYEADVMITEDGPVNLTEGLDALPDIVGGA